MRFPAFQLNHKILICWSAAALFWALSIGVGRAQAAMDTAAQIDQAVVSKLSAMHGRTSKIIEHVDLTTPFQTKTPWSLVIGKEPDAESDDVPSDELVGAVSVCFVNKESVDCSEKMLEKIMGQDIATDHGERLFYELYRSEVVYSDSQKKQPLLLIRTCTMSGFNGDCGVSTFLFDYDRTEDQFYNVFFNMTGRNNNQETRFIENGPLLGNVIVVEPTRNAPFNYWVEVHKRNASGNYARLLRYRGKTGYDDGNPLAVIDSEMPETLRHLKLWKPSQGLPIPQRMPNGCTRLFMRNDLEWCE